MQRVSESEIQQLIQIEGPNEHCILQRNNSGALEDKTGRIVRFGLGNVSKKLNDKIKSSDLIGIKTIVITPEMVGKLIGVFAAVEVKENNWTRSLRDQRENAQEAYINWVRARGGVAGFCKSVEDFKQLMNDFVAGLKK